MHYTLKGVLAADVANSGTITLSYPAHVAPETGTTTAGRFYQAMGHKLILGQNNPADYPGYFNLTFNASNITVTNTSGTTWLAGTSFVLQLESRGKSAYADGGFDGTGARVAGTVRADTMLVSLGQPATASSTAIAASQSVGAGASFTLTASPYVMDVPRNVVAAWTTASVITVRGLDVYGRPMTEVSASGTSFTGAKAFAKVLSITSSAAITGATAGTGVVLGLPFFLPSAGFILKEMQDGAAATAGTTVAGIRTSGGSTGTTGDVRGTYSPNSAPNGSRIYDLIIAAPDPGFLGIAQYSA